MPDQCRQSRLLASCELDGELPELDAARLRHHLAECADCATWVADAGAFTGLLRAAEPTALEQDIRVTALRRRLSGVSRLVVAGASAAAAAVAAVLVGFPSGAEPIQSSSSGNIPIASSTGIGCTACTADSRIVLTAYKQALIVPAPGGVRNLAVEIE